MPPNSRHGDFMNFDDLVGKTLFILEKANGPRDEPYKHRGILLGVDETHVWLRRLPSNHVQGFARHVILKVDVEGD